MYTYSDIVKFVAHSVISSYSMNIPHNDKMFIMPDAWFDGEFDGQDHSNDELVVNGWKYTKQTMASIIKIGKRNRMYANEWKKDGHTIYTLNESGGAAGGEKQIAVVADTKEAIECFCQDNNLPIRLGIQENDAINQTL